MLGTDCPIILFRLYLNSQMCTFLYILSLNKHRWKGICKSGFLNSGTINTWGLLTLTWGGERRTVSRSRLSQLDASSFSHVWQSTRSPDVVTSPLGGSNSWLRTRAWSLVEKRQDGKLEKNYYHSGGNFRVCNMQMLTMALGHRLGELTE